MADDGSARRPVEACALRWADLRKPLLSALPRKGGRSWERGDVAQQILLALSRRPEDLQQLPFDQLGAYAKRAAAHELSNARRGEGRCQGMENDWAQQQILHAPGAEELLVRAEEVAQRLSLLGRLPDPLLDVVVARDVEGLSAADAARKLRISKRTVRSRRQKAREMLRRLWDRHDG